jgi:hypothetical protein
VRLGKQSVTVFFSDTQKQRLNEPGAGPEVRLAGIPIRTGAIGSFRIWRRDWPDRNENIRMISG